MGTYELDYTTNLLLINNYTTKFTTYCGRNNERAQIWCHAKLLLYFIKLKQAEN